MLPLRLSGICRDQCYLLLRGLSLQCVQWSDIYFSLPSQVNLWRSKNWNSWVILRCSFCFPAYLVQIILEVWYLKCKKSLAACWRWLPVAKNAECFVFERGEETTFWSINGPDLELFSPWHVLPERAVFRIMYALSQWRCQCFGWRSGCCACCNFANPLFVYVLLAMVLRYRRWFSRQSTLNSVSSVNPATKAQPQPWWRSRVRFFA